MRERYWTILTVLAGAVLISFAAYAIYRLTTGDWCWISAHPARFSPA